MKRLLCSLAFAGLVAGCGEEPTTPSPLAPDGARGSILQDANGPIVDDPEDVNPGDGCAVNGCTLREAIAFANPGATITFATGLTGTIQLNDELPVSKNLTIAGPGAESLTVHGPYGVTNGEFRVFAIFSETAVSISGVTISGGYTLDDGGGILNHGTLTLDRVVVSGNRAESGGGIYNTGTLTVMNSTVDHNSEYFEGGGRAIVSWGGDLTITGSTVRENNGGGVGVNLGTLTIRNSTITLNGAEYVAGGVGVQAAHATITGSVITQNFAGDFGGGLVNFGGAVVVERSLISGNVAPRGAGLYSTQVVQLESLPVEEQGTLLLNSTVSGNAVSLLDATVPSYGGGIYIESGKLTAVLSTITGNDANTAGGGIYAAGLEAGDYSGPTLTQVKGSIVWGNTSGEDVPDDLAAENNVRNTFTSLGNNLFGSWDPDMVLLTALASDQTAVSDAGLGLLADNGGPTLTHALDPGSPAIDAGTCTDPGGTAIDVDQRGVTRPQGDDCDVGAFEAPSSAFAFTGFFAPVENPPVLNEVKAGRAVPLKFSLGGDRGLDVLAPGYPRSDGFSCDGSALTAQVDETATAGQSGLSYDASTDTYTYVWKTSKAWAGTCRRLTLRLSDDAATQTAEFRFVR